MDNAEDELVRCFLRANYEELLMLESTNKPIAKILKFINSANRLNDPEKIMRKIIASDKYHKYVKYIRNASMVPELAVIIKEANDGKLSSMIVVMRHWKLFEQYEKYFKDFNGILDIMDRMITETSEFVGQRITHCSCCYDRDCSVFNISLR